MNVSFLMPKGKKSGKAGKKAKKSVNPVSKNQSDQSASTQVAPESLSDQKSAPSASPASRPMSAASAEISNEDLYKKFVEQKDYVGLNNLGCRLIESKTENVEKRRKKEILALQCFLVAADQNNTIAQGNLARCFISGKGVAKDLSKAAEWLQKAAKNGNLNAKVQWAIYCWKKKVNPREIVSNLKAAAEQRNAYAQYYLGIMYTLKNLQIDSEGKPLTTDEKVRENNNNEAEKYLAMAAAQGSIAAKFQLGFRHYVDKKINGRQFHKILLETQSHPDSRCFLGDAHLNGAIESIKINTKKAISLLKQGEEEIHIPSLCRLGIHELENKPIIESIENVRKAFQVANKYLYLPAKHGLSLAIKEITQQNQVLDLVSGIKIDIGILRLPPPQDHISFWIEDYHGDLEKILLAIKGEKDFEEIPSAALPNDLKNSAEKSAAPAIAPDDKKAEENAAANETTTDRTKPITPVDTSVGEISRKKQATKNVAADLLHTPLKRSQQSPKPLEAKTEVKKTAADKTQLGSNSVNARFKFAVINDEPISDGIFRSYAPSTSDISSDADSKGWLSVLSRKQKQNKTHPSSQPPTFSAADIKYSRPTDDLTHTSTASDPSLANADTQLVSLNEIIKISTPIFQLKTGSVPKFHNSETEAKELTVSDDKRIIVAVKGSEVDDKSTKELLKQPRIDFRELKASFNDARQHGELKVLVLKILKSLLELDDFEKEKAAYRDFVNEIMPSIFEVLIHQPANYVIHALEIMPQLNTPLIAYMTNIEKLLLGINPSSILFPDLTLLISILPRLPVNYNNIAFIVERWVKHLSQIIATEMQQLTKQTSATYFAQLLSGITALYWHYYHSSDEKDILKYLDRILDEILLTIVKLKPLFLPKDLSEVYQALHAINNPRIVPITTTIFAKLRPQIIKLIEECEAQFVDHAFLGVNLTEAQTITRLFSQHTKFKLSSLALGCFFVAGYDSEQRFVVIVNQLGDYTLDEKGEINLSLFQRFRDEILEKLLDANEQCHIESIAHFYSGSLTSLEAFKNNIADLKEYLTEQRAKFPIFFSVDPLLDQALDRMRGLVSVKFELNQEVMNADHKLVTTSSKTQSLPFMREGFGSLFATPEFKSNFQNRLRSKVVNAPELTSTKGNFLNQLRPKLLCAPELTSLPSVSKIKPLSIIIDDQLDPIPTVSVSLKSLGFISLSPHENSIWAQPRIANAPQSAAAAEAAQPHRFVSS